MRPDMFKVIVERPRVGGRFHKDHRRGNCAIDDVPLRQGMRHPHRDDAKSLNENLNPLRRFLYGQVGRKWDDVYSEICEYLKASSTVQDHVRSHIDDFVDRRCHIGPDGYLWATSRYGRPDRVTYGLYVDPTDGVLKQAPFDNFSHWLDSNPGPERAPNFVGVGKEKELWKIRGIWYWAVFSDHPGPRVSYSVDPSGNRVRSETPLGVGDHIESCRSEDPVREAPRRLDPKTGFLVRDNAPRYYRSSPPRSIYEGRYRSGKRQASGKDLKKYGVSNDAK